MKKLACLLLGHDWSFNVTSDVHPRWHARFCCRCGLFQTLQLVDMGRAKVWMNSGEPPINIPKEGEVQP